MRLPISVCLFSSLVCGVSSLEAAITTYASDASTAALYSFNETAGAADPGNPFANAAGNSTLNLTNTGGPDGRDNTGGGGYGASSYSAPFGTAFNPLAAGDNTYHLNSSTIGGGATTGGNVAQSLLQGANGAFTYEALVRVTGTTAQQTILSHDVNASVRGFLFRIDTGNLNLFTGNLVGGASDTVTAAIPTTGANAFVANQWFHAAVTYNGSEGTPGNVTFYWTRLNEATTLANAIGTASLANDLDPAVSNLLGTGTTTRSPFRFEVDGLLDEVRISTVARGADQFVFTAIPEPSLLAVGGLGLLGLCAMRRRAQRRRS